MKTSEILTKAAEIMMERGHGKGDFFDQQGRPCVLGACLGAQGYVDVRAGENDWAFLTGGVVPYLAQAIRTSGCGIATWNDSPDTTEAMALGALHEAAILAKEQGD